MKKRNVLFLLPLLILCSCRETTSSDTSTNTADTSSSVQKTNQLTEEMINTAATGYGVSQQVQAKIKLSYTDPSTNKTVTNMSYSSYMTDFESTDNVYHVKKGVSTTDTNTDPVDPDKVENVATEYYYVPEEDSTGEDGVLYAAQGQLNLNNEIEYSGLYKYASDGETKELVEWAEYFKPFFQNMEASDFEKVKDEKYTFTFAIDESDTDETLLSKGSLIATQLMGAPGLQIESLTLHTDGYKLTEFEAVFQPYTYTGTTYDSSYNVINYTVEETFNITGNFSALGASNIKGLTIASGDEIDGFASAMNSLKNGNFAVTSASYESPDLDGLYNNKASTSYSASSTETSFEYWTTSSSTTETPLRTGYFTDDEHLYAAKQIQDASNNVNWYLTNTYTKATIKDTFVPSFKISSLLFEETDEMQTYRLKDEYLTSVDFESNVFDMFNDVTNTTTDDDGNEYKIYDFTVDLHEEGKIIFAYYFNNIKYVVTYSEIGSQAAVSLPTFADYTLSNEIDVVSLSQAGEGTNDKTRFNYIASEAGTTDANLIKAATDVLPAASSAAGEMLYGTLDIVEADEETSTEAETHYVFGYGSTDTSSVTTYLKALYSGFTKLGYTLSEETKSDKETDTRLSYLATKTITYNDKNYNINAHLKVLAKTTSSTYGSYTAYYVVYYFNITEATTVA